MSTAVAEVEISHASVGLKLGENISIDCPFCHGGANRDRRTCSVGRMVSGDVVYVCHRAKCSANKGGRLGGRGSYSVVSIQRPREQEFTPRVYSGVIEELPDEIASCIAVKYGISAEASRNCVGWDTDGQRTVWKIVSPHGAVRGYELRDIGPSAGKDRPKSIPYRHSPNAWVGYFRDEGTNFTRGSGLSWGEKQEPLIVVEDVISALKVSIIARTASLMGTHFTLEKALDLGGASHNIVLALDRDATEKARGIVERYAFILPHIRLLPLRKDMKYWSYNEIVEVVGMAEGFKTDRED